VRLVDDEHPRPGTRGALGAVGLGQADGRTLAETILADRDYPPFNRSSMDGYAIRYGDFEKGIRHYSVLETIYAGDTATDPIGPGECYKIMTGAPVPAGADTVIRKTARGHR